MSWHSVAIGLLFHGRIEQLFNYLILFNQLDRAVKSEDESPFLKEAIYAKFLRAKELVLYGTLLTHAQREKLRYIQCNSNQNVSQGIILGRYLDSKANISFNKTFEFFQIGATALLLFSSIILFIAASQELLLIQDVSFFLKAKILAALVTIYVLPGLVLFFFAAFPYLSWRKYLKKLR